jgi:hypothetical protein
MRPLVILLMAVVIGLLTSQQGISGNLTAYQGGKVYNGWVDDSGHVIIMNEYGKTIMSGHVNRMGGIQINDYKNDDTYQGRVRDTGNCTLNSYKGGLTLRLELER